MAQTLIDRIGSGAYARGDRLPKEAALGQEFGVSRPVLREALTILQCLGLVDALRTVSAKGLWGPNPLEAAAGASLDLVDLLEACCAFEIEALALTAGLSSTRDLPQPVPSAAEPEAFRLFHKGMARATGNAAISACITNLWDLMLGRRAFREQFILAMALAGSDPARLQALTLDAVRRGDPQGARAAAKALFGLYLTCAIDAEEAERVRRAHRESAARRSIWGGRLRADASPLAGGPADGGAPP